jgi:hypothetical protein
MFSPPPKRLHLCLFEPTHCCCCCCCSHSTRLLVSLYSGRGWAQNTSCPIKPPAHHVPRSPPPPSPDNVHARAKGTASSPSLNDIPDLLSPSCQSAVAAAAAADFTGTDTLPVTAGSAAPLPAATPPKQAAYPTSILQPPQSPPPLQPPGPHLTILTHVQKVLRHLPLLMTPLTHCPPPASLLLLLLLTPPVPAHCSSPAQAESTAPLRASILPGPAAPPCAALAAAALRLRETAEKRRVRSLSASLFAPRPR